MRIVIAACAAALVAAPAAAADIENVRTLDNVRSLDIAVNGTIRQQCAMGSIDDVDFGNLERSGLSFETRVAFNCNVPFTMTITGQRGALTHQTMPNGQGPYGGAVPYSIDLQLPLRHPRARVLTRTLDSRALRAGSTISSNGGIALDGMTLGVELGRPSGEAGLLAGEYSETITITVSPT